MSPEEFKNLNLNIPNDAGVYRYYDEEDCLLYVGKAKNLKKRVRSYFVNKKYDSARIKLLIRKIRRIEFSVTNTEKDALLLENSLIKSHQPKYNIQLKDDKSYPYVVIKNEQFPRVFLTRKIVKDGSEYLGPFASVTQVRTVMQVIRQLYPLRTCSLNLSKENIEKEKYKVCLEYHIDNCLGPCEGLQNERDYNKYIEQIRMILKGNIAPVKRFLKEEMQTAAEQLQFEKAENIKEKISYLEKYQSKSTIVSTSISDLDVFSFIEYDERAFVNYIKIINGSIVLTKNILLKKGLDESKEELLLFAITHLRSEFKSRSKEVIVPFEIKIENPDFKQVVPVIGDKHKLLQLSNKNAAIEKQQYIERKNKNKKKYKERTTLLQLKEDLRLKQYPNRIECFDNSNFQGSSPVASMVCFINGRPAKKEYRHYNIKTVTGPDDFASMKEIVYRRYNRLLKEQKELPQLILIDGGKGQLNAAVEAVKELDLYKTIQVASIAKRLEEIYLPNDPVPLHISKASASLKLLQYLRDEAHRFAITFHRKKQSKKSMETELDQIKGIGKETVEKLLKEYRSYKKIKRAPKEELVSLIGQRKTELLVQHFKD
ncbi:MAG: excinuclease ABC subunit UvrC [Chitinophagales bacterium]